MSEKHLGGSVNMWLTPCLKDMECDGTVFSDMGCDGTIQLDAKSWILDFANLDCG